MTVNTCIAMGKRIKEYRKANGYTQEKLAEAIDVTTGFITDIECGKKSMSLDTFIKVCEVLSVSADYLLFGTGERPENRIAALTAGLDGPEMEYAEDIMRAYVKAVTEKKSKEDSGGDG